MLPPTHDRTLSPALVFVLWLVVLCIPLFLAGALLRRTYFMRSQDRIEEANHVHMLSGIADPAGPLFVLEWDPSANAFQIVAKTIRPVGLDGAEVATLGGDSRRHDLVVGRYIYRFSDSASDSDNSLPQLRWELIGARIGIGDTVGRSPSFPKSGLLSYEPDRDHGHDLPLWMNGMPSNAFTVLNADSCGAQANAVCVEIGDPADRMTLERHAGTPQFTHLQSHQKIAIGSQDTLWIANLPYGFSPVQGSGDFNFALPDDYAHIRGDRTLLGPPGLNGTVPRESSEVFFEDITEQFKEHHIDERRWEPQTEDELQLLIDAGLLCLTYERAPNAAIVPQVKWADLTAGSCTDPLGQGMVRSPRAIDQRIMEMYERHRADDLLIARTNELLERTTAAPPGDFPLEFEWWPVKNGTNWTRMPVRVWGVRTGSTGQDLNPDRSAPTGSDLPTDEIVLRSRQGQETVLTFSQAGVRLSTLAETTLGLGPLLGKRDRIDGLDEISRKPTQDHGGKLTLTIDPDLQGGLWNALKTEMVSLGEQPGAHNQSSHYGITGIAMDTENGNVLAALNWPSGLIWEDQQKLQEVESRASWGVPIASFNWAMTRADKVGSVFKLLSIYTMADAGQLDGGMGVAGPSCGGSRGSPAYVSVLFTRNGRVLTNEKPFEDGQTGPLPTGATGLSGGLDGATAASCNSYFTLAATMLLDSAPPNLRFMENCPVDEKMRRTDTGQPTSREWLLCERLAKRSQKGGGGKHVHWLLLPEGESLAQRSQKPFLNNDDPGYFKSAIRAGLRLGFPGQSGEPTRPNDLHYETTPFRQDWMPGLPKAEGSVFVYPEMFSPLSYFGGGQETFGTETHPIPSRFTWREFAAQAIGENGQGSALSVADLYSAVGRSDGAIPAPRLVDVGDPSTTKMFNSSAVRLSRIREALEQPLLHGTAADLGAFLNKHHIEHVDQSKRQVDGIYGKTGTFVLEFQEESVPQDGTEPVMQAREGCGFVTIESLLSPAPADSSLLGTPGCEGGHLMVTGVQRYPASPRAVTGDAANTPRAPSQIKKNETHTTFVAVMEPEHAGHPVVFALIADLDETSGQKLTARCLSAPLLESIWNWMQNEPEEKPDDLGILCKARTGP